jgi:hypothetical protein
VSALEACEKLKPSITWISWVLAVVKPEPATKPVPAATLVVKNTRLLRTKLNVAIAIPLFCVSVY